MKIAVSSSAFSGDVAAGRYSILEWLDACANELEVDGVVVGVGDLARNDDEALAQIKKTACDLGLTLAAVSCDAFPGDARPFAIASALGAPLVVASAPPERDDPNARGAFVALAKARARDAKAANVPLALRPEAGTLCPDAPAYARISYDVDGSWLRLALDALGPGADAPAARANAVIATIDVRDVDAFARDGDPQATRAIAALARFRGFVVLDASAAYGDARYHAAITRFTSLRARELERAIRDASAADGDRTAVCEPG